MTLLTFRYWRPFEHFTVVEQIIAIIKSIKQRDFLTIQQK